MAQFHTDVFSAIPDIDELEFLNAKPSDINEVFDDEEEDWDDDDDDDDD